MLTRIIIRILMKLNILQYISFTIRYPYNKGIIIPLRNSIGYDFLFLTEEWLDLLLQKLLLSEYGKNTFADIGVNIGQTLVKVKAINPDQPYIGFEPNPHCLAYVNILIEQNQFKKVTLFPFAISQKTGVINLDLSSVTDSSASIIQNFRTRKTTPITIATCGPQLVNDLVNQKLGIIKIDVEGSESDVIEALLSQIIKDRPLIICEILPVYNPKNLTRLERQQKLEKTLKSLKYKILLINITSGLNQIEEIGIHSDMSRTNYLFCPEENLIRINNLIQVHLQE